MRRSARSLSASRICCSPGYCLIVAVRPYHLHRIPYAKWTSGHCVTRAYPRYNRRSEAHELEARSARQACGTVIVPQRHSESVSHMVRRAYVMASLEQYLALVINLAVLMTMARVLTPGEIGEAVTGLAIAVVAFSTREFVTSEFLIQRQSVDAAAMRTALTLQVAVSTVIAAALVALSGLIAHFYATPGLSFFLFLAAIAG